jgi:hypothetical protein
MLEAMMSGSVVTAHHRSNVRRHWVYWALACSTGLFLGGVTAGGFIGPVLLTVAELRVGNVSQIGGIATAGVFIGALYALLMGGSAFSFVALGGEAFGGWAGTAVLVTAALAITGLMVGVLQFDYLRRQHWARPSWILASTLGWAMAGVPLSFLANLFIAPASMVSNDAWLRSPGLLATTDLSDYGIRLALVGLCLGAASGSGASLLQYLDLRRTSVQASWWIPANIIGWGLGGMLGALLPTGLGLVLGGLVAGAVTGPVLFWLVKYPSVT